MISDYFGQHGMQTVLAAERAAVTRQLADGETSAIILDLHLGQDDGLDLLREIRSGSDVPVIIMTGRSHDVVDCIVGLELGADDYLTKPFGVRELYARIRAVLRRHENGRRLRARDVERGGYKFGGWLLNCRTRRLLDPKGQPVCLSKSEYGLLLAFLEAPERPLSREHLLQATRLHEDIFDRSIDVQVLRLRRKLEADPASPISSRPCATLAMPLPCPSTARVSGLPDHRDQCRGGRFAAGRCRLCRRGKRVAAGLRRCSNCRMFATLATKISWVTIGPHENQI